MPPKNSGYVLLGLRELQRQGKRPEQITPTGLLATKPVRFEQDSSSPFRRKSATSRPSGGGKSCRYRPSAKATFRKAAAEARRKARQKRAA